MKFVGCGWDFSAILVLFSHILEFYPPKSASTLLYIKYDSFISIPPQRLHAVSTYGVLWNTAVHNQRVGIKRLSSLHALLLLNCRSLGCEYFEIHRWCAKFRNYMIKYAVKYQKSYWSTHCVAAGQTASMKFKGVMEICFISMENICTSKLLINVSGIRIY